MPVTPKNALAALIAATSMLTLGYAVPSRAADTVELKSGLVLLGEVIEDKPEAAEIVFHSGQKHLTLPRTEIARISVDKDARMEFKRRHDAIGAKDAKGHFELYQWAQEKRFFGMASEELKATVEADANYMPARKALGLDESKETAKTGTPAEDAVFIGQMSAPKEGEKPKLERAELEKKVLEQARMLGRTDTPESARQDVVANFARDRDKVGDILLGALDYRKVTDTETRVGSVKGLQVAKPEGPRVSPSLAWSAVMDPSSDVRKGVVGLIKDRKDDAAVGGMIRHLIGAFNADGEVINVPVRDNAIEGLRAMKDDRIAEALFTYCVMELRPTQTEGDLKPGAIQSFTVLTGAQVTIVIPLTFPIDFPNMTIRRVRTTVSAPASALRAFTGQNFGDDVEKWKQFFGKK